jgi:copper-(or silver)-translocating P-type ATPase
MFYFVNNGYLMQFPQKILMDRERNVAQKLRMDQELKVVGMHCATCEVTVTKAISSVSGVKDAKVNLASGSARVTLEGGRLKDVVQAVRRAGYDVVTQKFTAKVHLSEEEAGALTEFLEGLEGVIYAKVNPSSGTLLVEINPLSTSPQTVLERLRERGYRVELSKQEVRGRRDFHDLLVKLLVGSVLTPFTLLPVPFLQAVVSAPVIFYSGLRFHLGTVRALRNHTTNMDVLVSLSSLVGWFYSLLSLLYLHEGYFFDASSALVTFILAGKTMEAYIKERTSNDVVRLQSVMAQTEDGRTVDSRELKPGDVAVVRSGEVIPADGVVKEGEGYVEESIYSGEVMPVRKSVGEPVIGGSTLVSGFLKVHVTRSGERTYLSQVVEAVKEAETVRLPIQSLVDRISSLFVPSIVVISLFTFLVWYGILHYSLAFSLAISIAVLASACPCGFGLATPMAIWVGIRRLVRRGIVVRNGESLERLKLVKTVIFDKTGTVTKGEMRVLKVEEREPGAMRMALALERFSNHPVAKAFLRFGNSDLQVKHFTELEGGVYGKVDGREVLVGNRELVKKNCEGDFKGDLAICVDWKVAGEVWLEDEIKDEARELVERLKEMRYKVVIATGDSSSLADRVGEELGVKVYKGLSPDQKVELVRELKGEGVMFVGDGVNDAQAMREADVGVAVSTGTDIAKYAGDVIVPNLQSLLVLIKQSRRTLRKVKENVAWALTYNAILVPIAAGVLYPFTGIYLPPEFAALGMAMNSVSVVLWSLVQ